MKRSLLACLLALALPAVAAETKDGWTPLFDGKTLDGWKANENPEVFKVEDGAIVVNGPRAHLFYDGPVGDHNFKNFEFRAEVKTMPKANSGLYFHTQFQPDGWPSKGYEVQVNNTHSDPKKTAGLYGIKDNFTAPAKDGEWFTLYIKVEGKKITTKVNDETVVEYSENDNTTRSKEFGGRVLSSGTFAIQGHDPESKAYFRKIEVKLLP